MPEFVMPQLGADMNAGTLIEWRVKPGDAVHRGDIIAEVETEKAAIEVEVFTDGVVESFLVQPRQKVAVGTPMAVIRGEGPKPADRVLPLAVPTVPAPVTAVAAVAARPELLPAAPSARVHISPLARRIAEQRGVDISLLHGTGPGGAITREDVEAAVIAAAPPQAPASPSAAERAAERAAMMRQTIAAAMARSKREIPHYYLGTTIDLGTAAEWLEVENLKRPVTERYLMAALYIKAVALALQRYPDFNALWIDDRMQQQPRINVGVAISLRPSGLVAPAIHDTASKSLDELMRGFADLVKRARAGSLRSSELSDPTITVTIQGEQGVEDVIGIIYPPQVALVGFGKVVERPWCVDGAVIPRPVVHATLSADHRATDGHRGALFLAAVDSLLQEPTKL